MTTKFGFLYLVAISLATASVRSSANVLGDMQTFAPSTDGIDFITVQSSRTLRKNLLATGGHLTLARNHLLVYRTLANQNKLNYKDTYSDADVNLAYGISDTFQISVATNSIVYQDSDSGQEVDVSLSPGLRVIRPGMKWNFSRANLWTALASVDFMNATNDPYTGEPIKPIYNLELVKNFRNGAVFHGFNLGYRLREATKTPADAALFPLRDQVILSYGRSAPLAGKFRWVGEIFGAIPVDSKPYKNTSDATALDLLLGVKYRVAERFNFDFGATTQPFVRNLSPLARVFGGLVYYWDFSSRGAAKGDGGEANFRAVPTTVRLQSGTSYRLMARGGVRPYTYAINSGRGEVDASNGNFTAPATPGVTVVDIKDARGNVIPVSIETVGTGAKLVLLPEEASVFGGTKMKLTASGGEGKHSYAVVSGQGSVDEQGYFSAPEQEEIDVVEITDAKGVKARSKILVKRLTKPDQVVSLGGLNFHLDSDELVTESKPQALRLIDQLKDLKFDRLVVSGHTDSTGSMNHNFVLSERRAETIKNLLVQELGIEEERVQAVGFGPSRPLATNQTPEGQQKNRRVEILVYK